MSPAKPPSAETISLDDFKTYLSRYADLVQSLSATSAKPGQRTLQDLDNFRYEEAPSALGSSSPARRCTSSDVVRLVEWKLRHGKFRPTLLSLVKSNADSLVEETIASGTAKLRSDKDVTAALNTLCALRGIGPATASLLLSVYDPEGTIFFSDEGFRWLCRDGDGAAPIKYSNKEYAELCDRAGTLRERLGVGMLDVERVAYVLMKQGGSGMSDIEATEAIKGRSAPREGKPGVKRKAEVKANVDEQPTRRSKRNK